MKDIRDFLNEPQTALFEKHGVIFAFSAKQFNEQKNPDHLPYVDGGAGMLVPKANWEKFVEEHSALVASAIKQDIEENGIDAIILRELNNHEYCYTLDPADTIEALADYGVTAEQVRQIASRNF